MKAEKQKLNQKNRTDIRRIEQNRTEITVEQKRNQKNR